MIGKTGSTKFLENLWVRGKRALIFKEGTLKTFFKVRFHGIPPTSILATYEIVKKSWPWNGAVFYVWNKTFRFDANVNLEKKNFSPF